MEPVTDTDPPVKALPVGKLKAIVAPGDTITTPKGNVVTRQEWINAKNNGLPFASHQDYADYVDRWATPVPKQSAIVPVQAAPTQNGSFIQQSDKALGYSNSYSPPLNRTTPTPASVKSNRY